MKSFVASTLWLTAFCVLSSRQGYAQVGAEPDAEFVLPETIERTDRILYKTNEFSFVRVAYTTRSGGTDTFLVDFPEADKTILQAVEQYLPLTVNPEPVILSLTDPELAKYPFIYMVEGGSLRLSEPEATTLRRYLLGGGFLMVDDFWGEREWLALESQIRLALPELEPQVLDPSHDIYRSFFQIDALPPIPGINELMNSQGRVDSNNPPQVRGLHDANGRLIAIFLHNMDFGDAWESVDSPMYPRQSSLGGAIPMGINIIVYALSH